MRSTSTIAVPAAHPETEECAQGALNLRVGAPRTTKCGTHTDICPRSAKLMWIKELSVAAGYLTLCSLSATPARAGHPKGADRCPKSPNVQPMPALHQSTTAAGEGPPRTTRRPNPQRTSIMSVVGVRNQPTRPNPRAAAARRPSRLKQRLTARRPSEWRNPVDPK
jgi:hypothetical protein